MDNIETDVVIVGAGFGGCIALHELRQKGLSAKIIEERNGYGGVWYFNRYPGVRVDSETPFYQLTLPEAWRDFHFTQRFPDGQELRQYFDHIADKLDLRKDTVFGHKIVVAKYDNDAERWTFKSDKGLVARSRFAVFATGSTLKAHIPEFPNVDKFTGAIIHPCAWPEKIDFKGKRVGIIGQGSSGIQIFQELAREDDCEVTVFVRTPAKALPMKQRDISQEEYESSKKGFSDLFPKTKYGPETGYPYVRTPVSFHDETPAERESRYECLWDKGGLGILANGYVETFIEKEADASMYNFWAKKARARIHDPAKREIVAPLKQTSWFVGKRCVVEEDYYELIDRPNVRVVDLKKTPIREFTADGLITDVVEKDEAVTINGNSPTSTANGTYTKATQGDDNNDTSTFHNLDIVIMATGYDSVTGNLHNMDIIDKNGKPLQEKWEDGVRTYLGLMVEDMPNAFILYGPQAPTSLANAPPFLELEVEWIVKLLDKMAKDNVRTVDVSDKAVEEWVQKVWQVYNMTLLRESDSWWVGSNVPGKKRQPLIWMGGTKAWWDECTTALEDWSNFVTN